MSGRHKWGYLWGNTMRSRIIKKLRERVGICPACCREDCMWDEHILPAKVPTTVLLEILNEVLCEPS